MLLYELVQPSQPVSQAMCQAAWLSGCLIDWLVQAGCLLLFWDNNWSLKPILNNSITNVGQCTKF